MSWSEADKARAIAIARTTDAYAASKRTGIPRRTISAWLLKAGPATDVMRGETAAEVGRMAWSGIIEILEETRARIHDPATRAGELASLLDVHLKAHALTTGGPTANIRTVNVNVDAQPLSWEDAEKLRQSIDAIGEIVDLDDDQLQAWLLAGRDGHPPGLIQLRDLQRQVRDHEKAGQDVG